MNGGTREWSIPGLCPMKVVHLKPRLYMTLVWLCLHVYVCVCLSVCLRGSQEKVQLRRWGDRTVQRRRLEAGFSLWTKTELSLSLSESVCLFLFRSLSPSLWVCLSLSHSLSFALSPNIISSSLRGRAANEPALSLSFFASTFPHVLYLAFAYDPKAELLSPCLLPLGDKPEKSKREILLLMTTLSSIPAPVSLFSVVFYNNATCWRLIVACPRHTLCNINSISRKVGLLFRSTL